MVKPLRVFISSPGDVVPERRRAALVIEKLAKDYARFFDIKPYLWESEPMLASGHFQDVIVPPGETDIVVLVLWARLGTALPEARYRGLDGRVPVTGTEWEFESALAAHREHGVPDLLAYKKEAPPRAEYKSDADLVELRRQLEKLDTFWSRHFVDQGEFRAAFSQFSDLAAFEAKLESDLRRLIEQRIAARKGDVTPAAATWLTGSPFRGLETYRFEHAPIFFGRSDASKTAVETLAENAEAGRPFLLVLGASGAGKSSLAQAGIVPALGVRGVVPGVGLWRRAVMRPGGHPGGPFMALAKALTAADALPELLNDQDAAALARHLEAAAADPSFLIAAALATRARSAREKGELLAHEHARLILVADQLEELFTLGEVTPEQRATFVLCLKGLMQGPVFIVATMRSDYWHRAAEVPLLVKLAEGHGRLDLLPPTQAEVTEMIRRPAEVAGLSFEIDPRSEIRLDAALAEEAARQPGALPLLSFLLDALYAQDVQSGNGSTLRYASMRKLGGFQGAIATRAEAAFNALPEDSQRAVPRVLRALVTVSRSGAEPTSRPVPMQRFATGSAERHAVDKLLDPQIRLLVADGDGSGARVRLAHEALITHWDRARQQIAQDRDDLRTRAMVEEAFAEWQNAKPFDKRGYLLRDPQLANAVDLEKRWSGELDGETVAFVQASLRRARAQQRMAFAAAAVFALIAGAASFLGWLALRAEDRAEAARVTAEQQRQVAVTERGRAQEQKDIAEGAAKRAEEQKQVAEQATKRAEEQRATAEQERDRAENAREVLSSIASTFQQLAGFVPEETEFLMSQSAAGFLSGAQSSNEKIRLQQADALVEMARYYNDGWAPDRALEFLRKAEDTLRRVRGTDGGGVEFVRVTAKKFETAGDVHHQSEHQYPFITENYQSALRELDAHEAQHRDLQVDAARVRAKLAAIRILQGNLNDAERLMREARRLLGREGQGVIEEAELWSLAAALASARGRHPEGADHLRTAIEANRAVLSNAQSESRPVSRLKIALAGRLQQLGDALRLLGQAKASEAYDEAEILSLEVRDTYPNQQAVRHILHLVRHGRALLKRPGGDHAAALEARVNDVFGSGLGKLRFGMTPAEAGKALGMPAAPGTAKASEYTTGNVQFFWLPVAQLAEIKSLSSSLCPGASDYAVFMFRENALFRISIRLFGGSEGGGCSYRNDFLPELAARFGIPVQGTARQWRLQWETRRVSLLGTMHTKNAPMLDIVAR